MSQKDENVNKVWERCHAIVISFTIWVLMMNCAHKMHTFPSTCMPVKCILVIIPNPNLLLSFAYRIALMSSAVRKFSPSSKTYMCYCVFRIYTNRYILTKYEIEANLLAPTKWSSSTESRRTLISVNSGGLLPKYRCWTTVCFLTHKESSSVLSQWKLTKKNHHPTLAKNELIH